jgi:HEAT repeat protein
MSKQPLADITNPQTRLAEFELRVREGSASEVRRTLLEAMADSYPPLRHQAAIAVADLAAAPDQADETFERMLRALAVGDPTTAVELAEPLGLAPDDVPTPVATVRQAACRALRTSSNDATRDALLEAADDDAPDVRYQALVSLHELDAHLQPTGGERFREVVERRLEDEDPEVAVVAAQIASQRGWTHTVDALIERWQEFRGQNKLQFALSLAELAGEHDADVDPAVMTAVVDQLIEALEDERTIAAASQALVQLGSERASEALENVIKRWFAHPILKVEAAGALHQLGDPKGSVHLEESLNSSRKDARGYALRLVGRLRISEFFGELSRVARSDDYHADTAVLALADYGGDEARAVLEEVAQGHPQQEVRTLASEHLSA